jgi:8-oxo-dGTP pyrophosphatase MutT (NUDIX family)
VTLERPSEAPFEVIGSEELTRDGNIAMRRDRLRWPDGYEADYRVVDTPSAAFVVPVHRDGTTVLVRQWRHPWGGAAWEVPAGTLEPGEEPLAGAQRELIEEAGLIAERWTSLGVARGTALITGRQHIFLARDLSRVQRAPERYEGDMIVRELPLQAAVEEALNGGIEHSGSVTALLRAARTVGLI